MQRNLIRDCSQSTVHVYLPPFKIPYSYCNGNTCFFSGGSRNFLLRGGVQTLVQKGLLNFLVATSPPKPSFLVYVLVAVVVAKAPYCFASRYEQTIRGYPKTITILNTPGIKFSSKIQRAFRYIHILQECLTHT